MVEHITDANFNSEVIESEKPVVVDFWAEWCGPCRAIGPIVEDLSLQYGDDVKFVKLNVDQNGMAPAAYGVSGIPTLLVFKGGKAVERIVGMMPAQALKQKIDSVVYQ
jgi:thioredoxin 1